MSSVIVSTRPALAAAFASTLSAVLGPVQVLRPEAPLPTPLDVAIIDCVRHAGAFGLIRQCAFALPAPHVLALVGLPSGYIAEKARRAGARAVFSEADDLAAWTGVLTLAVKTPADEDGPRPRRVEGPLLDYFETGTEGIVWTIAADDRTGHAALEPILEGDHLTVLDQLGATLWAGTIRCDRKVGWRRYPMNPKYGQQCALGYWVHWIQKGFQPDDWARFFVRPEYDRLRGILRRKRDQRTRCLGQK